MCGIAGIFAYGSNAPPADREQLRVVRDHMAARGPDGSGEWFSADGRVALGHRRLAIIDLSDRALQPMASADGQLVIVFNGEIYNHRELRAELERAGRVFRTTSDTEVLLQMYAEHGEAMLPRLRGMFGLAIWDARQQGMLLARGGFGIKPLYYADDGRTLRLASQVKALLAGGGIDTSPEPAGHAGFFMLGSVPDPWTLYKGIRSLPAGHFLWVDAQGARAPQAFQTVQGLIAAAAQRDVQGNREDALFAIAEAVRETVDAHLIADVPVGVFLSAGLDSAMITAMVARGGTRPQSLTLAFAEYAGTRHDEAPMAELLAARLGTRHASLMVRREDFEEDRERLLAAMDQPSIDGVNTWFVARAAASQGVKVALSGVGGDEVFASYPSFRELPQLTRLLRPFGRWPTLGRRFRAWTSPLFSRVTSPKYAGMLEYGGSLEGAYLLRRALFMPWELVDVLPPDLLREGQEALRAHEHWRHLHQGIASERLAISSLELSVYMRNQLLRDTDWASMAHSLEVRTPFVDTRFLEAVVPWMARFPDIEKKEVARQLSHVFPPELIDKPKTGFSVPTRQWLLGSEQVGAGRGLRSWASYVYERERGAPRQSPVDQSKLDADIASVPLEAGRNKRYELWAPEMAVHGGVQSYMWRLWEMLRHLQGQTHGPEPACISLMDSTSALRQWHGTSAANCIGASTRRLRFVRWALRRRGAHRTVIVGHVNLAPVAMAARLVGRIESYIVVLHGIEAWRRLSWVQRWALRRASVVVSTTRYTARVCAMENDLPIAPFQVIPLCADPHPAEPDPSFRLEGFFPVLFVGRLASSERYKGLETVIQAVAAARQHGPECTLHVIGDGDDRHRLERFARERGLGPDAARFHGRVGDAQLQAAYQSAGVFVMPSAKEGFGIVFLEAMRHGTPCIGGAHGGTPEVILNEGSGYLVRFNDVAALSQRIVQLAANPAERARQSAAARNRFEGHFANGVFFHRWQRLCLSLDHPIGAHAALIERVS